MCIFVDHKRLFLNEMLEVNSKALVLGVETEITNKWSLDFHFHMQEFKYCKVKITQVQWQVLKARLLFIKAFSCSRPNLYGLARTC